MMLKQIAFHYSKMFEPVFFLLKVFADELFKLNMVTIKVGLSMKYAMLNQANKES